MQVGVLTIESTFRVDTCFFCLLFSAMWNTSVVTQAAPEDRTPAGQVRQRRDKRGNPLEFFRLLTSLTKRW